MKIALICHAELLPSYKADKVHFGLNFIPVVQDSSGMNFPDDVDKYLLPWKFGAMKNIDVWFFAGNSPQHLVGKVVDPPVNIDAIRAAILTSSAGDMINLTKVINDNKSNPVFFLATNADQGQSSDHPEKPSWARVLGGISQHFPVVSIAMNYNCVIEFSASDVAQFDSIALAPEFTSGSLDGLKIDDDATHLPSNPKVNPPTIVTLKYLANGMPSPVVAYTLLASTKPVQIQGSFIDPTLWIANTGGYFESDWIPRLKDNLGHPFDMMGALLGAYREYAKQTGSEAKFSPETALFMRRALLATSRDGSGTGWRMYPPQITGTSQPYCFAEQIMQVLTANPPAGVTSDQIKTQSAAMGNALGQYTVNLEEWWKILQTALTQLSNHPLYSRGTETDPNQEPRLAFPQLADEIAQWEVLHGMVSNKDNAALIMAEQWRRAVASSGGDALAFWNNFCTNSKLSNLLSGYEVRSRQLQEIAARIWPAIVPSSGNYPQQVKQNLRGSIPQVSGQPDANLPGNLNGYLMNRVFTKVPASPFNDAGFLPSVGFDPPTGANGASHPLIRAISSQLDAVVNEFVDQWVPNSGVGTKPVAVPQPLVVSIESTRSDSDSTGDANDSSLAHAGVGLMMRETGTSLWSVLNMAELHYPGPNGVAGTRILDAAVAPSPLNYQGGMRRTTAIYNNRHLSAYSPLGNRTDKFAIHGDATPGSDNLFDLGVPAASEWSILPMLKYGRNYEAVSFAVGNCGALPKELAIGDDGSWHPSFLTAAQSAAVKTPSAGAPFASGIHTNIAYRRRVPIGAPRLVDRTESTDSAHHPSYAIPEKVTPIVVELRNAKVKSVGDAPFIFLYDGGSAQRRLMASFALMPPCTDMPNWERWVAGDDQGAMTDMTRQKLVAAWATFLEMQPKDQDGFQVKAKRQLLPDDPAVLPKFKATIYILGLDAGFVVKTSTVFAQNARESNDYGGLAPTMAAPVKVVLSIAPDGQTDPSLAYDQAGSILTVSVPKGLVIKVDVQSVIDSGSGKLSRFAIPLIPETDGSYLTQPTSLIVETATDAFPITGRDLYDALNPRLGDALNPHLEGRTLVVGLNPAANVEKFRNASPAVLYTQVWNWDGISVDPFPIDQLHDLNKLYLWDVQGFGRRSDDTAASTQSRWRYGLGESILFSQDLSADARSLYYRFQVVITSRYAGIYPGNKNLSAQLQSPINDPNEATAMDNWKRLFVPPLAQPVLPKPPIRVLIPLTQEDRGSTNPTAGMLIVTEDVAYQAGGVTESLEAIIDWPSISFSPTDFSDWNSGPMLALRANPQQFPDIVNRARKGFSKEIVDAVDAHAGSLTDAFMRQISLELSNLTRSGYFAEVPLDSHHSDDVKTLAGMTDIHGQGLTQLPNCPAAFAMVSEALSISRVKQRALDVCLPEKGPDPIAFTEGNTIKLVNIPVNAAGGYTNVYPPDVGAAIRKTVYMAHIEKADPLTMARVSFRRRVRFGLGANDAYVGDATQGAWMQLLPNCDLFGMVNVSQVKISRSGTDQLLQHSGPDGLAFQTMTTGLAPDNHRISSHWMILSYKAKDAFGTEGQETYEALYRYLGQMKWAPVRNGYTLPPPEAGGANKMVARIFEITARGEAIMVAPDPTTAAAAALQDLRFQTQREPDVEFLVTDENRGQDCRIEINVPFIQFSTPGKMFLSLISRSGQKVTVLAVLDYVNRQVTLLGDPAHPQTVAMQIFTGRAHWIRAVLSRDGGKDDWSLSVTIGDDNATKDASQTGVKLNDSYFARLSTTRDLNAIVLPPYFGSEPWEHLLPPYSRQAGRPDQPFDAIAQGLPMSQPIEFA